MHLELEEALVGVHDAAHEQVLDLVNLLLGRVTDGGSRHLVQGHVGPIVLREQDEQRRTMPTTRGRGRGAGGGLLYSAQVHHVSCRSRIPHVLEHAIITD